MNAVEKTGLIIDHLVDALAGDASVPLRRAHILAYIFANPECNKNNLDKNLDYSKPLISRDLDWFLDYGCIMNSDKGYFVCGYSQKNIEYALSYLENSSERLIFILKAFIDLFGDYKPSMRDAKILTSLSGGDTKAKKDILSELYFESYATGSRAVTNLIEAGFLDRTNDTL